MFQRKAFRECWCKIFHRSDALPAIQPTVSNVKALKELEDSSCNVIDCLGEMEPAREFCILQSQTQVVVSPKYRESSSSLYCATSYNAKHELASADDDISEMHGDLSGNDAENPVKSALSPVNRFISGFRKFLFGDETDSGTRNFGESVTYKTEVWNVKTKLVCRILALENFAVDKLRHGFVSGTRKMLDAGRNCGDESMSDENFSCFDSSVGSVDLLQQPTNVYVSIFTILSELPAVSLDSVPDTFLATVSHLRSPSEQQAINRILHAKSARSSSEDVKENDSYANEKNVVRVIVAGFNNECCACGFQFKQPVPQKHILISSLLRRQMNLSLTGKVVLTPLSISSDVCPAKISVYPLFSSVSYTLTVFYNIMPLPCRVGALSIDGCRWSVRPSIPCLTKSRVEGCTKL